MVLKNGQKPLGEEKETVGVGHPKDKRVGGVDIENFIKKMLSCSFCL